MIGILKLLAQNRVVGVELIFLALCIVLAANFFLNPENEMLAVLAFGAPLAWALHADLQNDFDDEEEDL